MICGSRADCKGEKRDRESRNRDWEVLLFEGRRDLLFLLLLCLSAENEHFVVFRLVANLPWTKNRLLLVQQTPSLQLPLTIGPALGPALPCPALLLVMKKKACKRTARAARPRAALNGRRRIPHSNGRPACQAAVCGGMAGRRRA